MYKYCCRSETKVQDLHVEDEAANFDYQNESTFVHGVVFELIS